MDVFYLDSPPALSPAVTAPMIFAPLQHQAALGSANPTYGGHIVQGEITGYTSTLPEKQGAVERRFSRLANKWKKETLVTSAIDEIVMNRHYQQIIGMGPEVVPIILKSLSHAPDLWFWALTAITHSDPVPKSDLGNLKKMTDAWLRWGRRRGYSV